MEAERQATPRPRTPRIVLRVPDPQKFRNAYVKDLADGGVFVKSEKLLAMGTAVEVELYAPGRDEPLALAGRVDRRVEPGGTAPAGMHVAFEGLDPAASRKLLEVVAVFSEGEGAPALAATPNGGAADRASKSAEGTAKPNGAPAAARAGAGEATTRPPPVPTLTAEAWPPLSAPWNDAVPTTVPAATDREDGIREVAELRGRLAAAEATIASLRAELAAHEEDEAGTRALAERLALQKNKLERARKREAEEAAGELERLRRELSERTASLNAMEARATEAEARAEVERTGRIEAEDRASEWKERCEETSVGRTEALARAEKLVASVEDAERMALDAEERAEELAGRLRAVEAERTRAVEVGGEHEQRAAGLTKELEAARESLLQVEARAEALAARLAAEEEAHRAARAEADETAKRLAALQETDAAERSRLLAELSAAKARGDETSAARARTEERLRDAEARLGEARARAAELEARVTDAEDRLGRVRAKEKDLRRLLAVVSAKVAEEGAAEDEATSSENGVPNGAFEVPVPSAQGNGNGHRQAEAQRPAGDRTGGQERPRPAPQGGVILAADLIAEAGLDVASPAPEGDIPVDVDLEETPDGLAFADFLSRLQAGSRVRRTETFRRYRPTEPSEIRLGAWLVQADGLDALRELARGKLGGDRLPRLLFDFYRRGLVELVG